jgi:hypothetical protein
MSGAQSATLWAFFGMKSDELPNALKQVVHFRGSVGGSNRVHSQAECFERLGKRFRRALTQKGGRPLDAHEQDSLPKVPLMPFAVTQTGQAPRHCYVQRPIGGRPRRHPYARAQMPFH